MSMVMLPHRRFRAVCQSFLGQVFQQPCVLCNRLAPEDFCQFCWRQLCQENDSLVIDTSGAYPLFAWGWYRSHLKQAIAQLKYGDCPSLGTQFGEELALKLVASSWNLSRVRIVAIPLHHERLRSRQYNQAEMIAQGVAKILGCAYTAQGLQRHRQTPALHTLSAPARCSTLKGAFALEALRTCDRRKPILLVDDIYTSGATIAEAQRVLIANGFKIFGNAVVAKTPSWGLET